VQTANPKSAKKNSHLFHQRSTHKFFVRNSFLAAFSSYILALAKNLYEKRTKKMLLKFIPDYLTVIFTLMESACMKAAHKMLVKLTLGILLD